MTETALPSFSRIRIGSFYFLLGLFSLFMIIVLFFLAPVTYPVWIFSGWFEPASLDVHQLHKMIGGAANWAFLAGLLLQLHKPARKLAGLQMVILMVLTSMIQGLIDGGFYPSSLIFLAFIGGIALLHPAREDMFRFERPKTLLPLALVGLVAVPVIVYVVSQMTLQLTVTDEHAEFLHYGSVAQITLNILLAGLLSAFETPGWRIPAWSAGLIVLVLGLASALFPDQASSVGVIWGILAVVWGSAFIGVSEWIRVRDRSG